MNNVDIVLLAAYYAGAALRAVDTEDIAVHAHKIDANRFSWRKYPEQIDLERVRVRLSQARVERFLAGLHSEGWRLTREGAEYVRDRLVPLAQSHDGETPTSKQSVRKVDRAWIAAERKRLANTSAFKKYQSGDTAAISKMEIREFFRIDEYMTETVIKEKLDRLSAAFHDDNKLGPMVRHLSARISEVMS
jgi:hypothetical protein